MCQACVRHMTVMCLSFAMECGWRRTFDRFCARALFKIYELQIRFYIHRIGNNECYLYTLLQPLCDIGIRDRIQPQRIQDVRSSFGWAEKRPKSSTTDI